MPTRTKTSFLEKHKEKLKFLLMYPTLVITMGSGIFAGFPTIIGWVQATMYGVPIGKWNEAQEQWELSKKNDQCLRSRKSMIHLKTDIGHKVTVLLCPTGDFRVQVEPLDRRKKPTYRWVGIDKFNASSSGGLSCNSVQAAEKPIPKKTREWGSILCEISYPDYTRQVRKYVDGSCDVIDVSRYTGTVIKGPLSIPCIICLGK